MKLLIVLGGGLTEDEQLNIPTKYRFDKTIEIYNSSQNLHYDYIICSSKKTYRRKNQIKSEAQVGKEYLIQQGIEEQKIIIEEESQDTFSNAYFIRKLIVDKLVTKYNKPIKHIVIVTSKFHIPKTKFVFDFVFPYQNFNLDYIESNNGIDDNNEALKKRLIS